MKRSRKGFTLVELLVVIAIVAILATVAIIGYTSFTNKAEESNDRTLVAQLNKTLIGGEFADAHDAFEAVRAAGFDVAKIDATAKNQEILWDNDNKQFFYTADETRTGDIWIVDDEVNPTYSTYYIGTEDITTDLAAKIVVYTNDAALSLKITAPNAHVEHEGIAGSIEVLAVANNSYYENGIVNALEVTTGKIVINGAVATLKVVGTANVNLSAGSETVKVIVNDATATVKADANAEVGNIATEVESVLGSLGTIVDGADDVIVDAVVDADNLGDFAGGFGTAQFPYLIVNDEQMQNISKYADTFNYYKVIADEIDGRNWTRVVLNGNFDGNGVVINDLSDVLFSNAYGESVTISNITIDADINLSGGAAALLYKSNTLNLTIDSVDVRGTIIGGGWSSSYVVFGPGASAVWDVTIKNSLSVATLVNTSDSASGFIGHPYNDVCNGDLNGSSVIHIIDSAFIGNMSSVKGYKYFGNNGNSNRVNTYYSESFIETLGYNPEGSLYNVPTDNATYPVIINEDGSKTFLAGNYGKNLVDNYVLAGKQAKLNTSAQSALPENIGDVFTINKVAGAATAVVSLQIAPNDANNFGSYLGTYITEEIDISGVSGTFTSSEVKYFTININSGITTETGVSGNVFNVVNDFYGVNAHNGAYVRVVQLDANGNVLNVTTVVIATPHAAE